MNPVHRNKYNEQNKQLVPVWPPPVCNAGRSRGSSGAAVGQSGLVSLAEVHGDQVQADG